MLSPKGLKTGSLVKNPRLETATPERGNAIRIGRLLSNRNVLGQHCIQIPKLFCSEEVENGKEVEDGTEKKRIGGHQ